MTRQPGTKRARHGSLVRPSHDFHPRERAAVLSLGCVARPGMTNDPSTTTCPVFRAGSTDPGCVRCCRTSAEMIPQVDLFFLPATDTGPAMFTESLFWMRAMLALVSREFQGLSSELRRRLLIIVR